MASAWISLTAYTVMMVLSYVWGQRNYPIPYNLKKNIIYLLSSVCIVFVAFVVFDRNLLIGNALFLIFTFTIISVERKELKATFAKK
jgi:O-antigen/teichoic acid export membrane protein